MMYLKVIIALVWLILTWVKVISWRVSAAVAILSWLFLVFYSLTSAPSATVQYQVSLLAYVAMIMAVIGRFHDEPTTD